MAWFLGKLRKKKYTVPPTPDPTYDLFHQVWERKKLPSPGVQNYAYETLALAPFSPISRAVNVRAPITGRIHEGQLYLPLKQGVIQGTPIVAGGIRSMPLYDPLSGYSGPFPASENNPFPQSAGNTRGNIAPAGEAL